jgi:5-methylcytosine-specific restriction protein A
MYDFEKGLDRLEGRVDPVMVEEGGIKENTLRMRQRSSQLVRKAREHFRFLDKDGKLRCSVCGYVKPLEIEGEIVHIHHKIPLNEKDEKGEAIPLELAIANTIPLCPNCHAVAHSKTPPLEIEYIKKLHN